MTEAPLAPSFTSGFALCTAKGTILGHTYRPTEAAAIACLSARATNRQRVWQKLQAEGWTVRAVYARVWVPTFFVSNPDQMIEENSE